MEISTEKKRALITGGSSGIGYAIAQKFLKENWSVIITGRDADKLERAVTTLGDGCYGITFDMAELDEIAGFVQQIEEKFGTVNALINNAGINQKKPFLETTNEDFERIIRVNQTALFAVSREIAQLMLKHNMPGSIVHITSMTSHYGIPKVISYTASKAAVMGMTHSMAVDLTPLGIRVNAVSPGFIRTPMTDKALNDDPERKGKVLSRTPAGRMGEPIEVANAVYFLASDEASFITGVTLKVDGGNSIGF